MSTGKRNNPNLIKINFDDLIVDLRLTLPEIAKKMGMAPQNLYLKYVNGYVAVNTLRRMETVFGSLEKYIIRKVA